MLLLHHYTNLSVNSLFDGTMPTYDGDDYYIPPFHGVILVPCNSDDPEHRAPSMSSCMLLTRTGVQTAEKAPLLVMYLIDNTSNVGLLLRHGDLLGAYYTGPHEGIKAERSYMFIGSYTALINDQKMYWLDVESAAEDYYNNEEGSNVSEDPTLDEVVVMTRETNDEDVGITLVGDLCDDVVDNVANLTVN
jgi:hypothetical protein